MFLYPSFAVCHPDTAKVLYKSSTPKSVAVGGVYRYLKTWIGNICLIIRSPNTKFRVLTVFALFLLYYYYVAEDECLGDVLLLYCFLFFLLFFFQWFLSRDFREHYWREWSETWNGERWYWKGVHQNFWQKIATVSMEAWKVHNLGHCNISET